MVVCNLSTLMGKKDVGIQTVHLETKLTRSTISNLKHNKAKGIDFDTIEKLCTYFECTPGDLLVINK